MENCMLMKLKLALLNWWESAVVSQRRFGQFIKKIHCCLAKIIIEFVSSPPHEKCTILLIFKCFYCFSRKAIKKGFEHNNQLCCVVYGAKDATWNPKNLLPPALDTIHTLHKLWCDDIGMRSACRLTRRVNTHIRSDRARCCCYFNFASGILQLWLLWDFKKKTRKHSRSISSRNQTREREAEKIQNEAMKQWNEIRQ